MDKCTLQLRLSVAVERMGRKLVGPGARAQLDALVGRWWSWNERTVSVAELQEAAKPVPFGWDYV